MIACDNCGKRATARVAQPLFADGRAVGWYQLVRHARDGKGYQMILSSADYCDECGPHLVVQAGQPEAAQAGK